jgi:hypothetical protein
MFPRLPQPAFSSASYSYPYCSSIISWLINSSRLDNTSFFFINFSLALSTTKALGHKAFVAECCPRPKMCASFAPFDSQYHTTIHASLSSHIVYDPLCCVRIIAFPSLSPRLFQPALSSASYPYPHCSSIIPGW